MSSPEPHINYNFQSTGKLRGGNGQRNPVETKGAHFSLRSPRLDQAALPSSAEGPYKAGTDASFNRK